MKGVMPKKKEKKVEKVKNDSMDPAMAPKYR